MTTTPEVPHGDSREALRRLVQQEMLQDRTPPTIDLNRRRLSGAMLPVQPTDRVVVPAQPVGEAPLLTEIHERGLVHSKDFPHWHLATLRQWHLAGIIRLWLYTTKTSAGHRLAWSAAFTNWEHT